MKECLVSEGISILGEKALEYITTSSEEKKPTKNNFSVKIEKISKEIEDCVKFLDSKVIVGLESATKQMRDYLKNADLELEKLNNNSSVNKMIQSDISSVQSTFSSHLNSINEKISSVLDGASFTAQNISKYFFATVDINQYLHNYDSPINQAYHKNILRDLGIITQQISNNLKDTTKVFENFNENLESSSITSTDLEKNAQKIEDSISLIKNNLVVALKNTANQIKDNLKNAALKIDELTNNNHDVDLENMAKIIERALCSSKKSVLLNLDGITGEVKEGLEEVMRFARSVNNKLKNNIDKEIYTLNLENIADQVMWNLKGHYTQVIKFAADNGFLPGNYDSLEQFSYNAQSDLDFC